MQVVNPDAKRSSYTSDEFTVLKLSLLSFEVIYPQVPLRIPCYDLTPLTEI